MKIVIFGLSVSSSWGNGHATLWRGLCAALSAQGHEIVFYERDVPYYAAHRDLAELPAGSLRLYQDWNRDTQALAQRDVADADVAIITSYCPDALNAEELLLWSSRTLRVFYDLDTPVTLAQVSAGLAVPYLGERGLSEYDLVLSYTGGRALTELQSLLGARRVAPLYGSVDSDIHRPVPGIMHYRSALSYLGTYAADRQAALEQLFLHPAQARPDHRFLIGGAQYPPDFPWAPNIHFVQHLPPSEHPAFFCSSRVTLNITRSAMALMGYCPSGRLFEAAACGAPVISDWWEGLDHFFSPGDEILVAKNGADVLLALDGSDLELTRLGQAARDRVLQEHTASHRALELERLLNNAREPSLACAALSH